MRQSLRSIVPAIVSAAAALGGCSMPLSSFETTVVTTPSEASTERTYRNVVNAMRVCYPALYTVETTYYPEAKEGEVILAYPFDYGRAEYFKATISSSGAGSLVSMTRRSNFPAFDEGMRAWVSGGEGGCPYGTKSDPKVPVGNKAG